MDKVNHEDMQATNITSVHNCNNTHKRNGGYELVSLSSEYSKHLSSVVLNNYNLLFGLSPSPFVFPVLILYIQQLNCLYSLICKICDICDSNCQCTCTCKCEPQCKANTICLCLSTNAKTETTKCCICICKKNDKCKCICICLCNDKECGCGPDKTHNCDKCLVKVDIGILRNDTCSILYYLNCIRCYISRLENQPSSSNNVCCCCTCCVNGRETGRCSSYCCCKDGNIDYLSIISRINSIELLFKEIGIKIVKLIKLKNILSIFSTLLKTCEKCDCSKDKINSLIYNVGNAVICFDSIDKKISKIKYYVDYKMFYPKSDDIIYKLRLSINPLLNQLKLINIEIVANSDYNKTSNQQLLVVYSHYRIFQCFLAMYILLDCSSKISTTIYNIIWLDKCECQRSNGENNNSYKISEFEKYLVQNCNKGLEDLKKLIVNNDGNHTCLCLVIKYILYPCLIRLMYYLRQIYWDAMSKQTKQFIPKMFMGVHPNEVTKLIYAVIITLDKVIFWIKNKYYYGWLVYTKGVYIQCFCKNYEDPYYPYLISIILFLSSLIENIWSMDPENIIVSIEKTSSLLSEYQSLHVYTYYGSGKSNNLKVKIPVLYNSLMSKGFKVKNGSNSIFYSGLSLKYKIFSFNNMSGHITSLMLINKLNITKDRLSRFYQIFSRLSFEINMKWTYTQIKIKRAISIHASNIYILLLKQMCSNNKCLDVEKCKCGVMKIYSMLILMILIYGKLKSKIDITEELLYIMDLLKKNKFDQYMKVMKTIGDDYINHNNMTIEYIKSCLRMLKNTQLTSKNYPNLNSKNSIETRNWGYDSIYEHQVTTVSNHKIISLFSIIFIGLLNIFTTINTN